jgi:hypothetical protein
VFERERERERERENPTQNTKSLPIQITLEGKKYYIIEWGREWSILA